MIQQWQLNQVLKLSRQQPDLVDRALDDLFHAHADLWRAVVVGAYLDREINLGKAAELLGLARAELQKQFIVQGLPLRLGAEDLDEARAEVQSLETWQQR